jgi:phage recombination protein Bet
MSEQEVVPHQGVTSITKRARADFDEGQMALIRDTVAKDCNQAELALFLETCARHQLDPIIKQIWTIKIQGVMQPVVSRDGLLSIANRHTPKNGYHGNGEFLGCQSAVVREFDFFDFDQTERADGTMRFAVTHKPRNEKGEPTHGGADGSLRGKIVGSWATVRRLGHDDAFFFAYWDQYGAKKAGGQRDSPWKTHPDAMMVKCAEGMALRKAFSVSGVIGEGEAERVPQSLTSGAEESSDTINWPEDEELAEQLRAGFKILGWRRAKVRLMVNSCEGDREAFVELLARVQSQVDEESAITDADVVDDPAAA